ncbi:lipocalin family protein [Aequorivita todarodis]|uniref:lipocalin family protein n=1 Tax=Aequorivita todarodis TaxID=2036821 RepID=UPI00234FBBF5|nr:lipocalin family protein [Aequorivita todarodis]MDC8002100.1 lipocalin family protein [Aequorivita todarodis]
MKRLMSVLLIAILFASCSSDDDNNDPPQATIVGAWTLTEANVEIPMDLNGDGTADRNFMNEVPCFVGTVAFTGNGTFSQTFSTLEEVVVNGQTTYTCNGTTATTGTYTLNGNQLTTTTDEPDPVTTTTTINLSGNTLKATIEFGNFGDVELVYSRN